MNLNKNKSYYRNKRTDLLALFPENIGIEKILEVGCGDGSTGHLLKKENKAKYVCGIEINEQMKADAEKKLDRIIIGDIEKIDLPFKNEYFDCIIFADVLEHLYDPWLVLNKITPCLKTGGCVLASIPNVQHWSIFMKLIRGKWDYEDEGILDNTHIRFFTKKSMKSMFEDAGFEIKKMNRSMGKLIQLINTVTLYLFSNFFTFRYLILAEKKTLNR